MKPLLRAIPINELPLSLSEFLRSYNNTIPEDFPKASASLLHKFKDANTGLFKRGELWSLDLHRKKVMDWLPIHNRMTS